MNKKIYEDWNKDDLISEIKKHIKVSIDEHITSKENVTFKLPASLN